MSPYRSGGGLLRGLLGGGGARLDRFGDAGHGFVFEKVAFFKKFGMLLLLVLFVLSSYASLRRHLL